MFSPALASYKPLKQKGLRNGGLKLAGWTRLELATFCVTGRRSNQLSYHPKNWERGRTLDSEKGVSSVLWKVCRRYFLEVLEGVFAVVFDLPAELLQAPELALRPEEMQPLDQ